MPHVSGTDSEETLYDTEPLRINIGNPAPPKHQNSKADVSLEHWQPLGPYGMMPTERRAEPRVIESGERQILMDI
jgi:hypothetical protein